MSDCWFWRISDVAQPSAMEWWKSFNTDWMKMEKKSHFYSWIYKIWSFDKTAVLWCVIATYPANIVFVCFFATFALYSTYNDFIFFFLLFINVALMHLFSSYDTLWIVFVSVLEFMRSFLFVWAKCSPFSSLCYYYI